MYYISRWKFMGQCEQAESTYDERMMTLNAYYKQAFYSEHVQRTNIDSERVRRINNDFERVRRTIE